MINLTNHNKFVTITIKADLINTSTTLFDLDKLKVAIISQLNTVYRGSIGNYKISFTIDLKILSSPLQCSAKKILFQIVNDTPHNNPAICDFKGLRIQLNKNSVNDIITGKNARTIPHEVGHLFGWSHPHANAKFNSINTDAHILEQQLSEIERLYNLMSQSWYAQKTGISLKAATQITEQQIKILIENFLKGGLNKNYHLKYFLWWRKII